ncbi:MAG: LysR substrate-binding domain-containing protein [Alphaproteobacteria bacterium]|nr:LysR substrate-binding domain-containing protein [Alphaproteobacteria bacterium]
MRLRQVEAFRATMLSGTITGASKLLNITQPSASRLISDLEANLGFDLFERGRGRLQPTPEGIRFFQEVERAFAGLDKLERVASKIREERTGHLTVHVAPALSTNLVPGALRLFTEKRPKVKVTIEACSPLTIFESLQAHSTDVAISNAYAELPGIEQENLINAEFICAIPPGHSLQEKEVITPKDFEGEYYIGLSPEGPLNWNRIDEMFETHGVKTEVRMSTQRAHTGYAAVAQGLGIGLLEPFSAAEWAANGVVIRKFRPQIQFSFSLCYPRHKVRSQLAHEFGLCVKQYLRENPPIFNEENLGNF